MRQALAGFLALSASLLSDAVALNRLADDLPAAVVVIDCSCRITCFNKGAEILTGFSRNDCLGHDFREICELENRDYHLLIVGAAQYGHTFANYEHSVLWNCHRRRLLSHIQPLRTPDGTVIGAIGVSADISALRENEHRMQHLESLAALGQVAASITHEIRNPLTAIKGFTQLLHNRALKSGDTIAANYCQLITQEVDHINNIASDFLQLSRPSLQTKKDLNLVKIINDVLTFLYGESVMMGHTLRSTLPKEPVWVEGQIDKLKEVFINLCRNGFQAMKQNGFITIELTADNQRVAVSVSDTGCGISPEQLDKIFQPFYTTKEHGTGLGLSICRRILEEHGGNLEVNSTVGQGSTFTLYLPRKQLAESSEAF